MVFLSASAFFYIHCLICADQQPTVNSLVFPMVKDGKENLQVYNFIFIPRGNRIWLMVTFLRAVNYFGTYIS